MGDVLIIAGIGGLVVVAVVTPIVVAVLRHQVKKLSQQIQQEYDQ